MKEVAASITNRLPRLFVVLPLIICSACSYSTHVPLIETCHCGNGPSLCSIQDIITFTTPDSSSRARRYFVSVMNNCMHCKASWVAVESSIPGYPTLLKNGAALNPWETVQVGPNPGPAKPHLPTQVNFTCIIRD
ncbi:hypothetical protein KP509_16G056200 [Ceratopteris richardii]|uniref:Uncharacterized protein n=1 Tax=Ceratopteris richardii TaxID=49495 RepID=A0A8T2T2A3_CERRI|nr:hypothetical protein KP509_16G056200 [Ceratopteris richardii]